jgi:hypothetical protein
MIRMARSRRAAKTDGKQPTEQADRRTQPRSEPLGPIGVRKMLPVTPLADVEVLNISPRGVAIRTRSALKVGDRLSFTTSAAAPPILAKVLACDPLDDGGYRVRCECLMGQFEPM